jgi:hypothetical protein
MKRPMMVLISPFRWQIKWGKHEVLKHHPNGDACGSCEMASLTIAVDAGRSEDYARAILLHEILHACIRSSDPTIEDEAEETAVAAITSPLLATLRDNPSVVAYLLGES